MRQAKIDFTSDTKFRTWSREGPLWWILYRTQKPGSFNELDARQFNCCATKYLIFLDHSLDATARELAIYLLDRFDHFKAAKVSKFARDGEKVLVLLANDDRYYDSLGQFVKSWNMLLWRVKPAHEQSDHEKRANAMWGDYITKLALAFSPPGSIRP